MSRLDKPVRRKWHGMMDRSLWEREKEAATTRVVSKLSGVSHDDTFPMHALCQDTGWKATTVYIHYIKWKEGQWDGSMRNIAADLPSLPLSLHLCLQHFPIHLNRSSVMCLLNGTEAIILAADTPLRIPILRPCSLREVVGGGLKHMAQPCTSKSKCILILILLPNAFSGGNHMTTALFVKRYSRTLRTFQYYYLCGASIGKVGMGINTRICRTHLIMYSPFNKRKPISILPYTCSEGGGRVNWLYPRHLLTSLAWHISLCSLFWLIFTLRFLFFIWKVMLLFPWWREADEAIVSEIPRFKSFHR